MKKSRTVCFSLFVVFKTIMFLSLSMCQNDDFLLSFIVHSYPYITQIYDISFFVTSFKKTSYADSAAPRRFLGIAFFIKEICLI